MATYTLHHGNNIEVLKQMIEDGVQVDAVVTDPPYGLKFMGKKWDYDVPSVEFWTLVLGVLKPGGHVLSFGGTRTYHRMVCNLEDAGFEIRDQIVWLYGSGFPKSMDVSKAIDKAAGAERERHHNGRVAGPSDKFAQDEWTKANYNTRLDKTPITPEAAEWDGWGTALKPAVEPIVLARKPLEEPTVASNVLKYRTGGINIDGCRVGDDTSRGDRYNGKPSLGGISNGIYSDYPHTEVWDVKPGRFPANVILDEDAGKMLDKQSGHSKSVNSESYNRIMTSKGYEGGALGQRKAEDVEMSQLKRVGYSDSGGASRFFYSAKASKKERRESKHPTVKPLSLMRYLCRLITPPGGTVLDPFAGSGTTGEAAILEGFHPVMIELEQEYVKDLENRMAAVTGETEPELEMPPAARNTATLESLFVD